MADAPLLASSFLASSCLNSICLSSSCLRRHASARAREPHCGPAPAAGRAHPSPVCPRVERMRAGGREGVHYHGVHRIRFGGARGCAPCCAMPQIGVSLSLSLSLRSISVGMPRTRIPGPDILSVPDARLTPRPCPAITPLLLQRHGPDSTFQPKYQFIAIHVCPPTAPPSAPAALRWARLSALLLLGTPGCHRTAPRRAAPRPLTLIKERANRR